MPEGLRGVLPSQWITKAIDDGQIHSAFTIPEANVQPASLDLRLGEVAYRLRCSFLPGAQSVEVKLADYAMGEVSLIEGGILERDRPYLIPLMEELRLPPHVHAKANPRSSTGRVDVFTRVVTDQSDRFDEVVPGYHGRLYLEVVPRSFAVRVERHVSLNQLRLVAGDATVTDGELASVHAQQPLLYYNGSPVPQLPLSRGLLFSLDLTGDENGVIGYRAKKNSRLLDLGQVGYDPTDYWEPVVREPQHRVVLEPEEFYLLLSAEAVRVPAGLAAEMAAFDPTSGELRTHYAGFFDPGFGEGAGLLGSRAALEVRAHDVPFVVENRQRVARLAFERMAEAPSILYGEDIGSSYQRQQVMLSKHFVAPSGGDQLRLMAGWP
ncbi:MAG: 2'-deoxycytidine 5'-triphosphate deaminase [Actinomycetota bacterium]|nr:2'-deoxycytidine 5'-triphosphate deaminase [Actinomycetota bacterium]